MKITVKQSGVADRQFSAHEGQTILSFLANQGLHLDAPCAGRGSCGKCRIKAEGLLSPVSEAEERVLAGTVGLRLACQARLEGEVVLELPPEARFSAVAGLGESEPYEVDSPLKRAVFPVPDRQDNTDLMTAFGLDQAGVSALDQLAAIDAARRETAVITWNRELLAAYPAEDDPTQGGPLAVAVDLGTTGLAVAILDAARGTVLAQGTALNPQTGCGGDVISRITHASDGPAQQAELQELAVDGIAKLIAEVAGQDRLPRIMAAAVSGNTTMNFLLAGINPKSLAQSPYRPAFIKSLDLSHLAGRLGLPSGAKVFTSPNISAYVGGDITSGMLAVGLKGRPGTVLYIDIGTNGEIVLSHGGRLVATSCAAGPALEGMNIMRGQRATPGAVDSFRLGPDYTRHFTTISEAPATGICGSGLIDLTAALVSAKLIDKTGRMKTPANMETDAPAGAEWVQELKTGRFTLAGEVFFDQKDVRQVQLAKGAIAAGVEMLLARLELTVADLDEIIIAGSFGFHLKPESLKAIGLIPGDFAGPVRFVGNSSLAGAARMLLTPGAIAALDALAAETTVLELGFDPQFQTVFLRHLGF